jgi:hypothetical protein
MLDQTQEGAPEINYDAKKKASPFGGIASAVGAGASAVSGMPPKDSGLFSELAQRMMGQGIDAGEQSPIKGLPLQLPEHLRKMPWNGWGPQLPQEAAPVAGMPGGIGGGVSRNIPIQPLMELRGSMLGGANAKPQSSVIERMGQMMKTPKVY